MSVQYFVVCKYPGTQMDSFGMWFLHHVCVVVVVVVVVVVATYAHILLQVFKYMLIKRTNLQSCTLLCHLARWGDLKRLFV